MHDREDDYILVNRREHERLRLEAMARDSDGGVVVFGYILAAMGGAIIGMAGWALL